MSGELARADDLIKSRVTWDEHIIAEHDKDRGTRQKIDEPDTPFVRSPQTTSDNEEQHDAPVRPQQHSGQAGASSSSTYRGQAKAETGGLAQLTLGQADAVGGEDAAKLGPSSPGSDVDTTALASRLETWMRIGAPRPTLEFAEVSRSSGVECADRLSLHSSAGSSRSSSVAHGRPSPTDLASGGGRKASDERRIALSQDEAPSPKPASALFKAKRAQHYNEVSALRAFHKPGKPSRPGDSSPDSNTSDENARTKTNTNTNINVTTAKAAGKRRRKAAASSSAAAGGRRADTGSRGDTGSESDPQVPSG